MKIKFKLRTTILIASQVVFFIVLASCGGGNSDGDSKTNKDSLEADSLAKLDSLKATTSTKGMLHDCFNFENEFELDGKLSEIRRSEIDRTFNIFNTNFKNKNLANFSNYQESVHVDELCTKLFLTQNGNINSYISGLRVYYTIDRNNNLKFYYVASTAKTTDNTSVPTKFEFDFDSSQNQHHLNYALNQTNEKVYESDGNGNLIPTIGSLIQTAKENRKRYENEIRILDSATLTGFRNYNINDGNFVYVPFKTIYELSKIDESYKYIVFVSTAKKIPNDPNSDIKHYISMYTSNEVFNFSFNEQNLAVNKVSPAFEKEFSQSSKNSKNFKKSKKVDDTKIGTIDATTLRNSAAINEVYLSLDKFYNASAAANYGQLCPSRCSHFSVRNKLILDHRDN